MNNPAKQQQINLGSRSCKWWCCSRDTAQKPPKIGTSSLCSRAPLWADGWVFGSIIATGGWQSLLLPGRLRVPAVLSIEPEGQWTWRETANKDFPEHKWEIQGQEAFAGHWEGHKPCAWRNLEGKQRAVRICAWHRARCSQAPPAISPAALVGQNCFTELFPNEIGCQRKWLCSSLPSESVLELSGTSQWDLPQTMLNHLWSISNRVPFPACSSGSAPGAVILTPSVCPKDLMHFLSHSSVLKPSLPQDSSHRCKCKGCSCDLC